MAPPARPLHPAWRDYRRYQRILGALMLVQLLLVGLVIAGALSGKAFAALFGVVLVLAALPFLFLEFFRCPSCGQLWLLNAFSRRCRTCGLGLYQAPPPPADPEPRLTAAASGKGRGTPRMGTPVLLGELVRAVADGRPGCRRAVSRGEAPFAARLTGAAAKSTLYT